MYFLFLILTSASVHTQSYVHNQEGIVNIVPSSYTYSSGIPYTAKLWSGKTFAVVHKIHYSLENFSGALGHGHHVLYTASDSREKLV